MGHYAGSGSSAKLPDESAIVLKKASSSLNESPVSPNEPTPGPSEPPTDLNTAISALTESVTDLGNSISSPEELCGPSKRPTRSSNTSPEPGSLKKKQSSTDSLVEIPRPSKATKDEVKRFSWELGQEFTGFVSLLEGYVAIDIAKNILQLPIPANVCKRLVYFSDASIRSFYGAVGIVWTNSFAFPEWEGNGIPYPSKIDSTAVLELFGIACALELAVQDIDKPRAMVDQSLPQDKEFFQNHLLQTRSFLLIKTKDLFIFTDDIFALKRISGDVPYPPNGDISSQLEVISRRSKALDDLGVHVELHLSPGHRGIPGNSEADRLARRTQNRMEPN
ncbi:hypothetical protein E8E15_007809 [Penicillium rubens]|nr:hypothetical protein E8E15_007809 [Penicillium rubens]